MFESCGHYRGCFLNIQVIASRRDLREGCGSHCGDAPMVWVQEVILDTPIRLIWENIELLIESECF